MDHQCMIDITLAITTINSIDTKDFDVIVSFDDVSLHMMCTKFTPIMYTHEETTGGII